MQNNLHILTVKCISLGSRVHFIHFPLISNKRGPATSLVLKEGDNCDLSQ